MKQDAPRASAPVPWIGKLLFHLFPVRRRVILANLRRAFGTRHGEPDIARIAQAHYAHLARLVWEFLSFPFVPAARRRARVRVENIEAILSVYERQKGVIVLTGHFGNWEVATAAAIAEFPEYRGQFHVLRRPLWPGWFDRLVTRRFRRAGLGVLPKKGALDRILERLAAGDTIVFVFDQHAGGRDGILVDFFGHPAWTFRSLAILARSTGVPVVPMTTWREAGGHVVRFEEPLPLLSSADFNEGIRLNTRQYNAALEAFVLRCPEQWFWMHRRWKDSA